MSGLRSAKIGRRRGRGLCRRGRPFSIVLAALCVLALPISFIWPPAAVAQGVGDLMITPTRVVFEGRTRTAEVVLIHRGTQRATYRLSFQKMRMNENGSLEEIKTPGPNDRFAEDMIRYSPRRIVLDPGQPQTVRLLLRKPRNLEPGEYRSHFLIRALPPKDAGTNIESVERKPGEISVQLTMIYGVSIPVIVRHGDLSAKAALEDLALAPPRDGETGKGLSLRVKRAGTKSIYGDFDVTFTRQDGDAIPIGLMRGVAVYTPNESRNLRIPLNPPEGVSLANGRLRVTYRQPPDSGGAVLAEHEIAIP